MHLAVPYCSNCYIVVLLTGGLKPTRTDMATWWRVPNLHSVNGKDSLVLD